ncbi:MAG TPA: hypothetical protein DC047_03175 [Blastocatellia bacterium]|nr:hypothetical protein [Blastocatellia bacterium]
MNRRPSGFPVMYQNWGKLLFMHWRIEEKLLRRLIPDALDIDTFDGSAWIGVIPFTMWGIRASFLPPIPGTSAFHELNVRTYVTLNGVSGVWFFSLDAANRLAVSAARKFYGLPYFNAKMALEQDGSRIQYSSTRADRRGPAAHLRATWTIGAELPPSAPSSLEFFLTERYCLYTRRKKELFRARIHHQPWLLQKAQLNSLDSTMIESHGLPPPEGDPLLHYSEEQKVGIWLPEQMQSN